MAKRKLTATVQVGLQIREELRRRLVSEANAKGISLNAEIARRLEVSFTSGDTRDLLVQSLRDEAKQMRKNLVLEVRERFG